MKFLFLLFISTIAVTVSAPVSDYHLEVPDVALPSPDGDLLKLSSLEGDVVLIHFWASWCKPCRVHNPLIVDVYEKYRDVKFNDGSQFKIYSISLDREKSQWLNGIKDDKLSWEHHVSELKGFNTQAFQDYGLNGIPYTILLDPNGKVIATRVFGSELDQQLAKLL